MVLERKERSLADPDRAHRVGRNNGIGQQLRNCSTEKTGCLAARAVPYVDARAVHRGRTLRTDQRRRLRRRFRPRIEDIPNERIALNRSLYQRAVSRSKAPTAIDVIVTCFALLAFNKLELFKERIPAAYFPAFVSNSFYEQRMLRIFYT